MVQTADWMLSPRLKDAARAYLRLGVTVKSGSQIEPTRIGIEACIASIKLKLVKMPFETVGN